MTDRCLVTGGAGFIGSHVSHQLVARGHSVRVVDNLSTGSLEKLEAIRGDIEFIEGDLRDPDVCGRAARGIDVVYHIAALPSVPRSVADPWASHEHNVNATVRILQAAVDSGVRRVVFSSSSSVYGDTPALPKVESVEPLPRSPYAAAKLAAEQYVLAFARAGVIEGVALRYFNVFGPRQDAGSAYAAVIPAFMDAARRGTKVTIFGDGLQTRDFTYVDNIVAANYLGATEDAARVNGVVANVGAGARTSLLELLRAVERVSASELPYELAAPRKGDVRDSLSSLERAKATLGYEPVVDLEEGLRRTWEWFCER